MTRLVIPASIRESGIRDSQGGQHRRPTTGSGDDGPPSITWIIEITSQIIFSSSASVGFELLVGRDERSLELGFAAVAGHGHGEPGQLHDHHQAKGKKSGKHSGQQKGIYSRSVKLVVDDTESLWNKPPLPTWHHDGPHHTLHRSGSWTSSRSLRRSLSRRETGNSEHPDELRKRQQKIHLVIITHGLHSNLGADMLYMKESIDAAAAEARIEARKRRKGQNTTGGGSSKDDKNTNSLEEEAENPMSGGQEDIGDEGVDEADPDDEMVIVRGFNGNCVKTERGIQYLGKRLAKYVMELTYPDQPVLPIKRSFSNKVSSALSTSSSKDKDDKAIEEQGVPAHSGSTIRSPVQKPDKIRAYKYTSISFIGHSLGGLVQTYAVAYLKKHSPTFFDHIKPVNFVCLASPLLGLSNENPMYVKFALDFGLVGRTGQDLGLTWRPPTIARSGWTAMGSVFGSNQKDQKEEDPGAKPLLRVLPTGPAHQVLHLFRNRTLYSNVVNDGIVPLRTSCLLFLDWQGLGRVNKARRENGLIGTMASWGYAELLGQNSSLSKPDGEESDEDSKTPLGTEPSTVVPQPSEDITNLDDAANSAADPATHQFLNREPTDPFDSTPAPKAKGPIDTLWSYIRPSGKITKNDKRMFSRSQTVMIGPNDNDQDKHGQSNDTKNEESSGDPKRPQATKGESFSEDPANSVAPPKTTVFESASDLLNPPIPPRLWLIDPSARARTIFHDRIYHPEDIPPPPLRKARTTRTFSTDSTRNASISTVESQSSADNSTMRVEEKIARAYHKGLSWRKVLVRLEPDAHNNIIVRRKFANAYGWPVVKHVCDTHFADTYSAQTRDENEPAIDRAMAIDKPVTKSGEEVKGQSEKQPPDTSKEELREQSNELSPEFKRPSHVLLSPDLERHHERRGTATTVMTDSYLDDRTSDDDEDEDDRNPLQKFLLPSSKSNKARLDQERKRNQERHDNELSGTSQAEIADFLTASPTPVEGHRGLGVLLNEAPEAEADAPGPAKDGKTPQAVSPPPVEPEHSDMRPGSSAELGLRKSLEEAIGAPAPGLTGAGRGGES